MSVCGHGGWSQACLVLLLGWTDDMHRPVPWLRVTAAAEVRTDHGDADVYIYFDCCCPFCLERSIYINFNPVQSERRLIDWFVRSDSDSRMHSNSNLNVKLGV